MKPAQTQTQTKPAHSTHVLMRIERSRAVACDGRGSSGRRMPLRSGVLGGTGGIPDVDDVPAVGDAFADGSGSRTPGGGSATRKLRRAKRRRRRSRLCWYSSKWLVGGPYSVGCGDTRVARGERPGILQRVMAGRFRRSGGGRAPRPRDVRELIVDGPEPGRVLLGRLEAPGILGRSLNRIGLVHPALANPRCYGVLVVGPARSGKTVSLLVPAVRGWQGPVISTSIRTDVLEATKHAREDQGSPILVYNPKDQGGYGSNTWSPLIAAMGPHAEEGARRTAAALIEASGIVDGGKNAQMEFWNAAAADYLGPLLLAAAQDGPSMEPVLRWLRDTDNATMEVTPRLARYPQALAGARTVWALSQRQRDSINLTARTALSAYQDPGVMRTCQGAGPGQSVDITPDSVLGGPNRPGATLYILSPTMNWRYFAPLFTALLQSVISEADHRATGSQGLDPPLLLALDEVANITPLKELPHIVSTGAGSGIQLVTVLQDLGQSDRIWGSEGTRTLVQNHYARLILGGGADTQTLQWVQQLLGEAPVPTKTRSRRSWFDVTSVSRSTTYRPVTTTDELRTMRRGTGLLICGTFPAARVRLRPWTTI